MNISVRWALRLLVFVFLCASSLAAVLLRSHFAGMDAQGTHATWTAFVPLIAFAAFVAVFSLDRIMAVQRRGYPPAKALFQVGTAVVFLTLLWPTRPPSPALISAHLDHARPQRPLQTDVCDLLPAEVLLTHEDPEVRAAACALMTGEALGVPHPLPPGHPLEGMRELLASLAEDDPSPSVRHFCSEAVGQLAPTDGPSARPNENGFSEPSQQEQPLDDDLTDRDI